MTLKTPAFIHAIDQLALTAAEGLPGDRTHLQRCDRQINVFGLLHNGTTGQTPLR